MKKTALISDLDQTFYIGKESLSSNIKLAKDYRSKGNIFGFATGRTYTYFKKVISNPEEFCDYLIINHGAVILKGDGSLINYYPIEKELLAKVDKIFENNNIYVRKAHDIYDTNVEFDMPNITKVTYRILDLTSEYSELEFNKAVKKAHQIKNIINSEEDLNIRSFVSVTSKNIYVEIVSIMAEKSFAIAKICEIENIPLDRVITVGDDETDIKMIEKFYGFAMENGNDAVKDVAKMVAADIKQAFEFASSEVFYMDDSD